MERVTMKIDGMSCGHCVSAVSKALKELEHVEVEQVQVGAATVTFDPTATNEDLISKAIEDQGYSVIATDR